MLAQILNSGSWAGAGLGHSVPTTEGMFLSSCLFKSTFFAIASQKLLVSVSPTLWAEGPGFIDGRVWLLSMRTASRKWRRLQFPSPGVCPTLPRISGWFLLVTAYIFCVAVDSHSEMAAGLHV